MLYRLPLVVAAQKTVGVKTKQRYVIVPEAIEATGPLELKSHRGSETGPEASTEASKRKTILITSLGTKCLS